MSRVLFRGVTLFAISLSVCAVHYFAFRTRAGARADQPRHGLTGNYYVSTLETHSDANPTGRDFFVQVWFDPNDFQLPKPFGEAAAVRVDSQIAFGRGKGFGKTGGPTRRADWAPLAYKPPKGWKAPSGQPWDYLGAVIWKGYIHFPKAGTYYLTTVSNGPSAVYLNNARVTLNGNFGGGLVFDAFSYAKEDMQDYIQNVAGGRGDLAFRARPQDTYVVPIPVDGPRDMAIGVQYQCWAKGGLGIDLFWVTPDSPRDANGKPVAQVVPTDVLYSDAPSKIEQPTVRSANSTISADFLDFPTEKTDKDITVTVRLADKDGHPVAGKRVHVSSVTSYGNADSITEPDKPTDEKGETTAKLRAGPGYKVGHDSAIFATDVTDLVDVAQVAHVTFQTVPNSLFPDNFSPYYGEALKIEPQLLVVGRPVTVSTTLENRSKFPAEVTATFKATDWNIGATVWPVIGEVSQIQLRAGEVRRVSITWTPTKQQSHQCFRVELSGKYLTAKQSDIDVSVAALLPGTPLFAAAQDRGGVSADGSGSSGNMGNLQQNKGPVEPPCSFPANFPGGVGVPKEVGHCKPDLGQKEFCRREAPGWQRNSDTWFANSLNETDPELRKEDAHEARYHGEVANDLLKCWLDPPKPSYERLAPALTDTPAGYIEALTKSMERYQGAQADGDREGVARQATAMQLYEKRLAEALRQSADKVQRDAEQVPRDDPKEIAKLQAASDELFERLHRGGSLTADEQNTLRSAGLSEEDIKGFARRLAALGDRPQVKGPRALLLDAANLYRQTANDADQLAGRPITSGEEGKSTQTYTVANPHDKQENVDLFIRPMSIPPDWKLSIVNAELVGGQKLPAGDPPQFPVREAEVGKHYVVTLPAKAEVKVASVVIPVGEVGANTTARWAVEGKIGDELIGGIVHEMNVPYIISDLKLPPVGSKEVEEELPVPPRSWARVEVGGGIVILGLLAYFLIFWRRRRRAGTSAVP